MSERRKILELDIAVLGGGFAGVYCAKRLARQSATRKLKIGLVSEENYMVFQPMLAEVAGGSVSPRHVVNPLRLLCRGASVFKGRIEKIAWPERKLTLNAGAFAGHIEVRYKHLVVSIGAVIDLSRIPGMPEHAFLLQNVGDAMLLRSTIISRIEEANLEQDAKSRRRLLTFVVVGGGYSGVEAAGQILDLFRSIHVFYPGIDQRDLHVYLVHSRDHLLPHLNRRLGDYSARKLVERGLKLILNQRVKDVTANRVYLQDGSTIESNTVISTVGNAPHPLILSLCSENGLLMEKGRIVTESTCQVKGQSNLWAAGDCAAIPYVKGGLCPATAQFAMRQGLLLAENIGRSIQGKPLRPFTFAGFGEMAGIGHRTAVADVFGFNFSGLFAWWLWRTVYLFKLPRLDRKIRVLLDWTLDFFFPKDINVLSPRYSMLFKEIHLEKGHILFRKDDPAFSFYIIKNGGIEISDEKGVVTVLTSGDYFGEQALMGDGIWHFDAVATEPSTLVSIPARIFHQITRGSGSLGRFFRRSANKYQSREMIEAITLKIPAAARAKSAAELMNRDVQHLSPDMRIGDALRITREHPHSSYPVLDKEGRILGVCNREDFYDFIKRPDTSPDTSIAKVTLSHVPILREDSSVDDMIEYLIRSGANKLLVIDKEQRLRGIITMMDLITAGQ